MKNKLQPTRTSFSRNFQCKKAPRWLSKFFSFWYWKSGGPVKKTTLYVVNAELPGAGHWGRQPEKEVHQRHPHRLKVIPGSHQCEFLTFEAAWFPEISSTILGFAENLFVSDFRGGPLGESKDSVDSVKPVIEKHFSNYLWTFSISTRIQSQRTAQLMDHLFAIMIGEQILICDLEKKLWGEPQ